jgi:hypothetical protein
MMASEPCFGPDGPMQKPQHILGECQRVVGVRIPLPFQRRDDIQQFVPRRRSGPRDGSHTLRSPRVSYTDAGPFAAVIPRRAMTRAWMPSIRSTLRPFDGRMRPCAS